MTTNKNDKTLYQPKTKLNHGTLFKWIDSLNLKPHLANFLRTVAGFWGPAKTPFPSNLRIASSMGLTKRRVEQIKAELRKLNIPFFKMVNTKTADKRKNHSTRYEFNEQGIWLWYRKEKNPIDDHGYKEEKVGTEMEKDTEMGGGSVGKFPTDQHGYRKKSLGTEMAPDSGLQSQTGMVESETEGVPKWASVGYRSGLRSKNTLKNNKHHAKNLDPAAGSGTRSRDSSPPAANTFEDPDGPPDNQTTAEEQTQISEGVREWIREDQEEVRLWNSLFNSLEQACRECEHYDEGFCGVLEEREDYVKNNQVVNEYMDGKRNVLCPVGKVNFEDPKEKDQSIREEEVEKKRDQQGSVDIERYKKKCSGCKHYSIGYCLNFVEIIGSYRDAKICNMLENGHNCPLSKWQVDERDSSQFEEVIQDSTQEEITYEDMEKPPF